VLNGLHSWEVYCWQSRSSFGLELLRTQHCSDCCMGPAWRKARTANRAPQLTSPIGCVQATRASCSTRACSVPRAKSLCTGPSTIGTLRPRM
jgi:hypothetical protein